MDGSPRLVMDYQKINIWTVPDHYPLLLIEQLFMTLQKVYKAWYSLRIQQHQDTAWRPLLCSLHHAIQHLHSSSNIFRLVQFTSHLLTHHKHHVQRRLTPRRSHIIHWWYPHINPWYRNTPHIGKTSIGNTTWKSAVTETYQMRFPQRYGRISQMISVERSNNDKAFSHPYYKGIACSYYQSSITTDHWPGQLFQKVHTKLLKNNWALISAYWECPIRLDRRTINSLRGITKNPHFFTSLPIAKQQWPFQNIFWCIAHSLRRIIGTISRWEMVPHHVHL